MRKVAAIREQFQHFWEELSESFWGDLYGRTRLAWKKLWEAESIRERERYCGVGWQERSSDSERDNRNGFYERDDVTRFGTIRLRIARTRGKNFLPAGLGRFQRRADEAALLIREAFLRGISSRQVGRVVSDVDRRGGQRADGVEVDAGSGPGGQEVSPRPFERRWRLFVFGRGEFASAPPGGAPTGADASGLGGACGRQPATVGIPAQSRREPGRLGRLIARSLPARAAGEELGFDRNRRLRRVGGGDRDDLSAGAASTLWGAQDAQPSREGSQARLRGGQTRRPSDLPGRQSGTSAAFYHFRCRWRDDYPTMVRRLEKELPERLSFFSFPRHLWRKLRTTNVIERLFVEVRRRARPMVCFVNVKSVDRIIYSIFHRFNLEWNRTLQVFTHAA